MNTNINSAFLRISRRAEANERPKLIETFVDVGSLFTVLASTDHQVIYGRRGTGKTHALLYLAQTRAQRGDVAVYIDMRTIGSTGGIYADTSIPLSERATRLLMDSLIAIHDEMVGFTTEPKNNIDLSIVGPLLDELASAITQVAVVGNVTQEATLTNRDMRTEDTKADFRIEGKGITLGLAGSDTSTEERQKQTKVSETGVRRHRIHFGAVGQILSQIASNLAPKRVWVLLDEWSVVPNELQPLLADLLRRSLFPVRGITVKIGAIEQRTTLQIPGDRGDYTGIELGADIAADLNLDDYMVFDNDSRRATTFFQELLYRHYKSAAVEAEQANVLPNSNELVRLAFTH